MFRSINAKDYMTRDPVVFKTNTDLFEAIHIILERKITGATVLNDSNEVVGMMSEMDCLKAILDGSYYGTVGGTVGDYMTKEVFTVQDEMDITSVAKVILDNKRRRIPVVDNGKFIGQLSCRSILQAIKDFDSPHDPSEDEHWE